MCVFASTSGFFGILLPNLFLSCFLLFFFFPPSGIDPAQSVDPVRREEKKHADGSRTGYFSSAAERIIPDCKRIMLNLRISQTSSRAQYSDGFR